VHLSSFLKKKFVLVLCFFILTIGIFVGFGMQSNRKAKAVLSAASDTSVTGVTANPSPLLSPTVTIIPSPKKKAEHSMYLGMWTQGLWDDPSLSIHPEKLHELEGKIGKKVAISHFYTGWENLGKEQFVGQLRVLQSNGWRPMISANPYFFASCSANGKTLYQSIASGDCDTVLKDAARGFREFGSPILFRFAWEMNIDSMGWSIQKTGSSPSDFIAAWRRFHDITRDEGASNVIWVFSPNTLTGNSIAYSALYPGSDYVDWVGLDGYNWGSTQPWSHWQTFTDIFQTSYYSLLSVAPDKPMMIAEVNSTDVGGDKASWYKSMLDDELPSHFPSVKAVVFFNESKPQERVNWLIDSTSSSLVSFSQSIRNPMYLSSY
jgi:beta-mannanase